MNRFIAFGKRIWRLLEWFFTQLGWISGALTIIMMIAVVREVVGRYFFRYPSDWSIELSSYLLVGMVYLAAADIELVEGHVRIDIIYLRLKGKIKNIIDIFIPLLGLCWSVTLVWQGGKLAWKSLVMGARSSDAMMWPVFPSQVLVPIGASLLSSVLICKFLKNLSLLLKRGK